MSRRVARVASALYAVSLDVIVWGVLAPLELLRIVARRATIADLTERLARNTPPTTPASRRVLVHAVSVGEMAAAAALADALSTSSPACSVLLSSQTKAGRRLARDLRYITNVEGALLLPWDRRAALRAWLRRLGVDAVVTVETEIWPGLYLACEDLDCPLFIVSGRLAPRDVWRYRLARPLVAAALDTVRWLGVQDGRQRSAFLRIGSSSDRIEVLGDLKADAALRPIEAVRPAWRLAFDDGRPLLVAGSTHAPEERLLVRAFERLRASWPDLRLVVAPRRVTRARAMARWMRPNRVRLWSDGPPPAGDWDILLIDRFGPLRALYPFADLVYIGGTMSGDGGHNVLEAAAAGRAIIVGTNVEHIRSTVDGLEAADAIRRVTGFGRPVDRLHDAVEALLADPDTRAGVGRRARAYVEAQRGVASRYAVRIAAAVAIARRTSNPPGPVH